ncbi:T9SS type A sorting domain-containing protein [bacterium AH-315-M05]|nr:T9SS type A sorting domain-containing protein [bacterium AH-315-M05]
MMMLLFLLGMNESVYSQDNDGDGFTVAGGDCNDSDTTIYPGATEIPDDGIDQDCNGFDLITCYMDADMDGYGDAVTIVYAPDGSCDLSQQESYDNTDCDDANPDMYPGNVETLCDGIDNNCNGMADDDKDTDFDGVSYCSGDCDDNDNTVYPGAPEICGDGLDNNCDGFGDLMTVSTGTNVSCYGVCDGSAFVTASEGPQPYTYLWNDTLSQITDTAYNLCAGTYVVSVTDNNGCTATDSVIITEPDTLTLTITSITPSTCSLGNGGACVSITGGTLPYVFPYVPLWDDPGATTGNCITGAFAGVYNPIAMDTNGCTATILVVIPDTGPTIDSIVTTDVTCNGDANGTAQAFVSGGTAPFTYVWKDGGGDTIGTSNPVFGLIGGTYTLTYIDSNGCIASGAFSIIEPTPIASAIISSTPPSCFGICDGSITVAVGGGTVPYSYLWNPSGQTTATATGLCTGTYNVLITDANGCTTTNSDSLIEPDLLVVTPSVTDVSCFGDADGAICLNVQGGTPFYSYIWSPPVGSSSCVTNLTAGNYNVAVFDVNGCIAFQTMTVNEPTLLIASGISSPSTCGDANGIAIVYPSGGTPPYMYLWSDPNNQTNDTATGLLAGNYTVIITDANGCTLTFPITVTNTTPTPTIDTITTIDVDCNGAATGTATVLMNAGCRPLTYQWNTTPVQTDSTATGLLAGTYTVIVSDSFGQTDSASITILEPDSMTLITFGDALICYGDSTQISVTAFGGTGAYMYSWSQGLSDSAVHMVSPAPGMITTYTVVVTDANGCIASDFVTVSVNPPLSITTADVSMCEGDNTIITAVASGGNGGPYFYMWDNGDSASSITVSPSVTTIYIVVVSDGCSTNDTAYAIVTVNPIPTVAFSDSVSGSTVFFTDLSTISGGAINGWTWGFGDGAGTSFDQNPTYTYINDGNYEVCLTVTSSAGCSNDFCDSVAVIGTAIQEQNFESSVNIYPNPTEGLITFDIELSKAGDIEIQIYNVLGELLYSKAVQKIKKTRHEVNMGRLANGVYFVKLVTSDSSINKKIILYK